MKGVPQMKRVERMRASMLALNLDACVVSRPENIRYLSGFTGGEGILFIRPGKAYLLTDFRYIEQAKAEAPDFEIVQIKENRYAPLKDVGGERGQIGFEGDFLTYTEYEKLQQALPEATFRSVSETVTSLRGVKDAGEIALIRQAVKAADDAFDVLLQERLVGQTEEEIFLALEFAMRKAGASGRSFDFIVASGWRGALPHGTASSKVVERGEFLTLDFGGVVHGYCSDITRTVAIGEPDEKQREIYDIVLAAQKEGVRAVKPGLTGKEVDAVARKVIETHGYGEYFGHGLGHSVGLAIHEGPNLSVREERILEPGMVLTVEPGIYIPNWGGVRIEDMVLVTETGCEVLTQSPKDLIIIE